MILKKHCGEKQRGLATTGVSIVGIAGLEERVHRGEEGLHRSALCSGRAMSRKGDARWQGSTVPIYSFWRRLPDSIIHNKTYFSNIAKTERYAFRRNRTRCLTT